MVGGRSWPSLPPWKEAQESSALRLSSARHLHALPYMSLIHSAVFFFFFNTRLTGAVAVNPTWILPPLPVLWVGHKYPAGLRVWAEGLKKRPPEASGMRRRDGVLAEVWGGQGQSPECAEAPHCLLRASASSFVRWVY